MTKNYIVSEKLLEKTYFRTPVKVALAFFLMGTGVTLSQAQTARVVENPTELAKLSDNEAVNQAAAKMVPAPVIKTSAKGVAALNGVYTVGVSGNYPTLTAAVADFNAAPIEGPVTFSLLDQNYPSETFPITINANAGSSAANTLTIKPAAGVNATISGSAPVLVKVNGADYVTIDGSNDGTGSDNLILNNIDATAADNPTMLWVASTATDGADHVTLKNIKFLGLSPSGTIAGILVSGPTFGAAGTIPNNYLTVESNTFNRAQNAMFVLGLATNQDDGAVIKDNTIGSTDPLERMGFRGIAVQNAKNATISGNKVLGVSVSSTSTSSGILVGATINNVVVTGNDVSNISNTNTTGYGSNGIYSNAAAGSSNVLISNNFVRDVYSRGYNSGGVADNGNGIVISGAGTGIKVYHNTVALNTNQTAAGRPAALNILSSVTAGAVDVRNNILVNNQTVTGERYAIYSGAANSSFSNIDYNNYFTTGPNLGFIGSSRSDLAAVQAGFGGNVNSLNVAPVFASATDLHLTASNNDAISDKGTALAEVAVDIDGEVRNSVTPDMGADEFTAVLATDDITKSTVKIYPNPVVDFVSIKHSSKIDAVEVYNVTGQKVGISKWNAASGTMDMRNLAPGIYIIKVKTGNDVKAVKVIKK